MPRDRRPSDDARLKNRPHVRVPLGIRNPDPQFPELSEFFADPLLRGLWLGLVLVAGQAWAGETGDHVLLSPADLHWITGRKLERPQRDLLARVTSPLGYPTRTSGRGLIVHVQNLSEIQGWGAANRGALRLRSPKTDTDSDLPLAAAEPTEQERSEERFGPRRSGGISALADNLAQAIEDAKLVTAQSRLDRIRKAERRGGR